MKTHFKVLSIAIIFASLYFAGCKKDTGVVEPNTEKKSSETVSQTIQVVDKNTGIAISGVKIGVNDFSACYVPQITGITGSVTFSTQRIATIFASCSGYANFTITPMMSFASYTIYLIPLPSNQTINILLNTTYAYAPDILALATTLGLVTPLGRLSLGQINTALGYASLGESVVCTALAPVVASIAPCYTIAIITGLASNAGFLAVQLGVPESQLFEFYKVNFGFGMPSIIMIPVQ